MKEGGSGAAAGGGAVSAPRTFGGPSEDLRGILGAWVYFWQQADGLWAHPLAVLEGPVWPALAACDAFSVLR
jgi:hypothetical protein